MLPARLNQFTSNRKLQRAKAKIAEANSTRREIRPDNSQPIISADEEKLLQEAENEIHKVLAEEPYHKEALELLKRRYYQEIYSFMADYDKYRQMNLRLNPHDVQSTLMKLYFGCINISLGLIDKYPEFREQSETFLLERIFVGADILFFDPYEFFLAIKDSEYMIFENKKIFHKLLLSNRWQSLFSKSPTLKVIKSIEEGAFETSMSVYEKSLPVEGNGFLKKGAMWKIVFEGEKPVLLQDRKGIGMIAYMLSTPYKHFHVQELKIGVGSRNQLPLVKTDSKREIAPGYIDSEGESGISPEDRQSMQIGYLYEDGTLAFSDDQIKRLSGNVRKRLET